MKKYIILALFSVAFSFLGGISVAYAQTVSTATYNVAYDNELNSRYPDTVNSLSQYIKIGHRSTYGDETMRYVGKFDLSTNISNIQKAVIKINRTSFQWDNDSYSYSLYGVNFPWDTSTITWNNAPALNTSTYITQGMKKNDDVFEFDVTELVKGWVDGTIANNGFIIAKSNEISISSSNIYGLFASSDYLTDIGPGTKPYLEIIYIKTTPTITSFTPTSGPAGSKITIYGTNLSEVNEIVFSAAGGEDISIAFYKVSDTELVATIPSVASIIPANSYNITLKMPIGSTQAQDIFTVTDSTPTSATIESLKAQTKSLIATIANLQNQLLGCQNPGSFSISNSAITVAEQVLSKSAPTVEELTAQINALLVPISELQTRLSICEIKPNITITYPVQWSTLEKSKAYSIKWTSRELDADINSLSIRLISDKYGVQYLGSVPPNNSYYTWVIPNNIITGTNYRIQIVGINSGGEVKSARAESGYFSIIQPTLTISPTISYFTPPTSSAGSKITIYGTNLSEVNEIVFSTVGGEDISIAFSKINNTELTAYLPSNIPANSYNITVKTPSSSTQAGGTLTVVSLNSTPTITPPIPTPTPPMMFNRNMWRGLRGNDVKKLQEFLNSDPNTRISESGLGSPGQETNYYGFLTQVAVQNFQCKNGIVCSGSPDTNGYGVVGPKTREKMQEVSSGSGGVGSAPTPASATPPTPTPATSASALQQQIQQMLKQLKVIQEQLKTLQSAMVIGVFGR